MINIRIHTKTIHMNIQIHTRTIDVQIQIHTKIRYSYSKAYHMRWSTLLQRASAFVATLTQDRLRAISKRARRMRAAFCATYIVSLTNEKSSIVARLMYD